ncbi:hypothetical protein Clacol_001252 [Clathrus columnatus]|uniref:tRNA ligase n=1 Tax=Clathrus columnatus TaxID=1419009 RepID=A0AAV5A0Q8_9AGAM|nr:hypothetical protein Clacol_001252 [Clathrus columnatus]
MSNSSTEAVLDSNHELINALQRLSKKSSKLVRSSTYPAPAEPNMMICSWKMNEFKYYEVPSPFPTLARGLFSRWIAEAEGEEGAGGVGRHVIIARGYDKFFNIGEVPWTNWAALETHTVPPYDLTLKSNGCIVFIAALTPSKLIVTSKHSLGPIQGQFPSHAQVGEKWLRIQLEKAGKTEEDLAKKLWETNETAVAELCDDSFEEHVLPYSEEVTGLHLHGINKRSGAFQTQSPSQVQEFAREWGFIPTPFITFKTVAEVRSFSEEISKSGKWNNQPIEGFVVRTYIAQTPDAPASTEEVLNVTGEKKNQTGRSLKDAPPYPPGSSFFFKVKFDEPYMMYRDWREITKSMLTAKPGTEPRISKAKLNRPETKLYKQWLENELKTNRGAFAEYTHNKGIISNRERFLKWCEDPKGEKLPPTQEKVDQKKVQKFEKTVIVPIAIPGCGKTSIAVALKHLFNFGHTQSDDVKAKRPAPIFLKNVADLLRKHDVVIADKNNHLGQHRSTLREALTKFRPRVRLIALNWSLEQPPAMIHRTCSDRVQIRGENHQSLRADEKKSHEEVLWMFIDKSEPLSESEVDDIIEMDIEEDLEANLMRAVEGLCRILEIPRPSEEKLGEALALATNYAYRPTKQEVTKAKKEKEVEKEKKGDTKLPRYFGILPEIDLKQVIDGAISSMDTENPATKLYKVINSKNRIASRPHITIVHSKSLPAEQPLWDSAMVLHRASSPPTFKFKIDYLVCNERVMALSVVDMNRDTTQDGEEDSSVTPFFKALTPFFNRLHITVGTADRDINPLEAKYLIEEWRRAGANEGVHRDENGRLKWAAFKLHNTWGRGRVKGLLS